MAVSPKQSCNRLLPETGEPRRDRSLKNSNPNRGSVLDSICGHWPFTRIIKKGWLDRKKTLFSRQWPNRQRLQPSDMSRQCENSLISGEQTCNFLRWKRWTHHCDIGPRNTKLSFCFCEARFHVTTLEMAVVRITSLSPKFNGSHFGLPCTQRYPQNDWTGWQFPVHYDVCARRPFAALGVFTDINIFSSSILNANVFNLHARVNLYARVNLHAWVNLYARVLSNCKTSLEQIPCLTALSASSIQSSCDCCCAGSLCNSVASLYNNAHRIRHLC